MGNSKSQSKDDSIPVCDLVVKCIHDESSYGYMRYTFVQNGAEMHLNYDHPNFHVLVKKLKKDQAYCIHYTRKMMYAFGGVRYYGYYIHDVTDVPSVKITGTIVDYTDDKWIDQKDNPYSEVLLEKRPLKIPDYDYYCILLIDKKRIPALSTGVPYEFTVTLFRGANEFLIGEINKAPAN